MIRAFSSPCMQRRFDGRYKNYPLKIFAKNWVLSLTEVTIQIFAWRLRKTTIFSVWTAGVPAEIRTQHLPNTSPECFSTVLGHRGGAVFS
jgi:hypothetical protein